MGVDTAESGVIYHVRRQDLPVSRDDNEFRVDLMKFFFKRAVAERVGLIYGYVRLFCDRLDRRRQKVQPAPFFSVRLSHDGDHVGRTVAEQSAERYGGDVGRPHKQDAHFVKRIAHPSISFASSSERMRTALSVNSVP